MKFFPKVITDLSKFSYVKMVLAFCEHNKRNLDKISKLPKEYKTQRIRAKEKELREWNSYLLKEALNFSSNRLGAYFDSEILILEMSFFTLAHELVHHFIFIFRLPLRFHKLLDRIW